MPKQTTDTDPDPETMFDDPPESDITSGEAMRDPEEMAEDDDVIHIDLRSTPPSPDEASSED